jgi:predicted PurR-regulated permease PerM
MWTRRSRERLGAWSFRPRRSGKHSRGQTLLSDSSSHDTVGAYSGRPREAPNDAQFALLALTAVAVALAVVVAALALWKGLVVVLLLFLAYTLAAAVRPSVERLLRLGVPHWAAVFAHLAALVGAFAVVLWVLVPLLLQQVQQALDELPAAGAGREGRLDELKYNALHGIEAWLRNVADPKVALSTVSATLAAVAAVAFTVACAAYWLNDRDRLVDAVVSLVPERKRVVVRDTWLLIDLKLGAVIRTKVLLVVITSTVLSIAFWIIGLPYFLLIAAFAGIVEVLPVIGPLLAGLAAVGAGLTVSWKVAVAAAIAVYGFRVVQDYLITPHLFGRAVHLPPLVVLIAVSALALLLGAAWVPLAIPIIAVISTLLDVLVWKEDPADEQVPSVLVPTEEKVRVRRRRSNGRRLKHEVRGG